jgi:hypothetical protein
MFINFQTTTSPGTGMYKRFAAGILAATVIATSGYGQQPRSNNLEYTIQQVSDIQDARIQKPFQALTAIVSKVKDIDMTRWFKKAKGGDYSPMILNYEIPPVDPPANAVPPLTALVNETVNATEEIDITLQNIIKTANDEQAKQLAEQKHSQLDSKGKVLTYPDVGEITDIHYALDKAKYTEIRATEITNRMDNAGDRQRRESHIEWNTEDALIIIFRYQNKWHRVVQAYDDEIVADPEVGVIGKRTYFSPKMLLQVTNEDIVPEQEMDIELVNDMRKRPKTKDGNFITFNVQGKKIDYETAYNFKSPELSPGRDQRWKVYSAEPLKLFMPDLPLVVERGPTDSNDVSNRTSDGDMQRPRRQ